MGLLWGGNFEPDESCWAVMNDRGEVLAKADGSTRFPTHAEAITYAHEQATRQALAACFTIPPENPVARAMQEPPC
ncbi:hypothetical protein BLJ79_21525 [Arthrobacter sp. UCD-GKA]|nr:hypothetical protein BLJ79_21525 [Arthrobacter sp. UCD-GKA]